MVEWRITVVGDYTFWPHNDDILGFMLPYIIHGSRVGDTGCVVYHHSGLPFGHSHKITWMRGDHKKAGVQWSLIQHYRPTEWNHFNQSRYQIWGPFRGCLPSAAIFEWFLDPFYKQRSKKFASKKYQSSASLAFVRKIHRLLTGFPHKGPVTRRMFQFDDAIML